MCLALSEASAAKQASGQKVEGPPECRLSCSTPGGLLLELTSHGQVRPEPLSPVAIDCQHWCMKPLGMQLFACLYTQAMLLPACCKGDAK